MDSNPNIPEDLRKFIEARMANEKADDLAALNRRLKELSDDYNHQPQEDFLKGYSPAMAHGLRHPWNTPGSPIQFARDLTLEQVSSSALFQQIRTLLLIVSEQGRIKATKSGNFNRKFVESMVDVLLDEDTREVVLHVNKVLNEPDVWPLHEARIVASEAGLLHLVKGTIGIPKKHQSLLEEGAAGKLFLRLFDTYFKKYNIGYRYSYGVDVDWLQHQIDFVLYPLSRKAQQWTPIAGLPEKILHPMHFEQLRDELEGRPYFTPEDAVVSRLIKPLAEWGLLEIRKSSSETFAKPTHVRLASLFGEFVSFNRHL
ncbi:MAG: hypothetical protein LAT55_10880 [Opitutales bacterium]|nr:hypothetical protein [Opitutales bacterium]